MSLLLLFGGGTGQMVWTCITDTVTSQWTGCLLDTEVAAVFDTWGDWGQFQWNQLQQSYVATATAT